MSRRSVVLTILLTVLVTCPGCGSPMPTNSASPGEPTLITGIVKDSNGSALGRASVKAVKAGSNFTASTNTNSGGEYLLDRLETGSYRITASLDGYLPSTRETNLSAGDQAKIDFELKNKPTR